MVYIHSLDFALIIDVSKIKQFHVSQFLHGTGLISPFLALKMSSSLEPQGQFQPNLAQSIIKWRGFKFL